MQEGGEIGQFYGYEYAGVDENGNILILNDKDEQIPISQADAKYKRYIGNGAPKHFLSWSNNLTWRNFDLSVFFRGTFGFDVFNMRKYGTDILIFQIRRAKNIICTTSLKPHTIFTHMRNLILKQRKPM